MIGGKRDPDISGECRGSKKRRNAGNCKIETPSGMGKGGVGGKGKWGGGGRGFREPLATKLEGVEGDGLNSVGNERVQGPMQQRIDYKRLWEGGGKGKKKLSGKSQQELDPRVARRVGKGNKRFVRSS